MTMTTTLRAAILLTCLLAACGSTSERIEVETLADVGEGLSTLKASRSDSTGALQQELEGMPDKNGQSIIVGAVDGSAAKPPPTMMSPKDLDSLTGVSPEAKKAQADAAAAAISSPPKFASVPFLAFKDEATLQTGTTKIACQGMCESDEKCRSFSFISDSNNCWVSTSHMQYDMAFKFYVKDVAEKDDEDGGAGGEVSFKPLGGVKYDASPASQAKCRIQAGQTLDHYDNCRSLAYRSDKQECIRSSAAISYNVNAKYYEKRGVSAEGTQSKEGKPPKNQEAQEFATPATTKEINEKASLTPEQSKHLKANEFDGTEEMQMHMLHNALAQTVDENKTKGLKKLAAAQKAAEDAKKNEVAKQAAEKISKSAYSKSMKENSNKMSEMLENVEKSEAKAHESGHKAEARSKEDSGKAKERLTHSAHCEKVQKNQETADLENAKLETKQGTDCGSYDLAVKMVGNAKASRNHAQGAVNKWEKDITEASRKLVYLALKKEIKASEEKLNALKTEVDGTSEENAANSRSVEDAKASRPRVEADVAKFKSKQVSTSSSLDAATLAVQGAATAQESTVAKAGEAAAKAGLAVAETNLEGAEGTLRTLQSQISNLQSKQFASQAALARQEKSLADQKIQLTALKNHHLISHANTNLKLSVGKHQLPLAKVELELAEKKLVERQEASKAANVECLNGRDKLGAHKDIEAEIQDETKMCTSEKNEKIAASAQAEQKFHLAKADFRLKMAKKHEQHWIAATARAKLAMATADTLDEKIAAGNKLADAEASKVASAREVQEAIPVANDEQIREGQASAKLVSAKSVTQAGAILVAADTAKVDKDKTKLYAISKENPQVIVKQTTKFLAKLEDAVGLAEINAGERDTTNDDMNTNSTASLHPDGTAKSVNGTEDPLEASAAALAEKAAKDLAAGDKTGAAADMQRAQEAINPAAPTEPPTNAPTEDPNAVAEQAHKIVSQVKETAKSAVVQAQVDAAKSEEQLKVQAAAAAATKETNTKNQIKAVENELLRMKDVKTREQEQEQRHTDGMSGQWPFAGSTAESIGNMGDATVKDTKWESDTEHGKCLGFDGPESQADLGDMKLTTGTISFWLRIDTAQEQTLFGPGMEVVDPVQHAAMLNIVSTGVQNAITNALNAPITRRLLQASGEESTQVGAKGSVSIMADGSVSIFDGAKLVSLSAAAVVPVGVWVQLLFSFADNKVTLFVNGALQHTGQSSVDFDGHPFILGRGFQGAILNLDVWHRTLSVAEIARLPKPAAQEFTEDEFAAHTPQGRYDLAKSRADDLERRELAQRDKMKSASDDIKEKEKEDNAALLRDKLHELQMAKRKKDMETNLKARQAEWEEEKKRRDNEEVAQKSQQSAALEKAKTDEQAAKHQRMAALDQKEQDQAKQFATLQSERAGKQKTRQDMISEAKTKESTQKNQIKKNQASNSSERQQKQATSDQIDNQQQDSIDAQNRNTNERQEKDSESQASEVQSKQQINVNVVKTREAALRLRERMANR